MLTKIGIGDINYAFRNEEIKSCLKIYAL